MRSFHDIVKELKEKYPETKFSECPKKEYIYYFYYNGQPVHVTHDINDPMIEKGWIKEMVCTNKKEIDNYWNKLREVENEAVEIFKSEVRHDFHSLSDELFELCWSKSYNDNHSSGYDEVANGMWEIVDFVDSIIETTKTDFINKIKNIKPQIVDVVYGQEPTLYDMINFYYNHYVGDSNLAKKYTEDYIKSFSKEI